jgi:hypothetical protein
MQNFEVVHRGQEIEINKDGVKSYFTFSQSYLDELIMTNKLEYNTKKSNANVKFYTPKQAKASPPKSDTDKPIKVVTNDNEDVFKMLKTAKIRLKKEVYQDVKAMTAFQVENLMIYMSEQDKKMITVELLSDFLGI